MGSVRGEGREEVLVVREALGWLVGGGGEVRLYLGGLYFLCKESGILYTVTSMQNRLSYTQELGIYTISP